MSLHLHIIYIYNLGHVEGNDPNKSLKQQKVKLVMICVLDINDSLGLHNFDFKNS
jgi:hypothetical protein